LTPEQAIAFVQLHGVVLESANGPVPSLVQAIAGVSVKGNWWAHSRGKEIFQITRAVRESDQILVCRLIAGKVTLVHRSIWPALIRCAEHFRPDQISQIIEEHTSSGKHISKSIPFPEWVPPQIARQASNLTEEEALNALNTVIPGAAGTT
jgi:hypothetical protein